MATIQEVVDYVNNLIISQEIKGLCFNRTGDIVIRVIEQYSDNQLLHLINRYDEITSYVVDPNAGFMEIVYVYEEVVP